MIFRILIFASLSLLTSLATQAQIKFDKIYGGTGYDHARSVQQTFDHGYIVSGFSNVSGQTDTEVFLLKTDSLGAVEWFKFHGGDEIQASMCVQQTLDSGYIVTGYTNEIIENAYDFLLMKFDQDGELTWKKTYGGADWDLSEHVEQTFDGGYILSGSTFSIGNGGEDAYLIKTDANGNVQWSKTYGGSLDDQFQNVAQCSDTGFVAIGRTNSSGMGGDDIYVVRTNKSGDTLWTKTIGNIYDDYGKSILQNSDSTFALVSVLHDTATSLNKAYITGLDTNGDIIWSNLFNTVTGDEPGIIKTVPWGGYVYCGYNQGGVGGGGQDMFAMKTNSTGAFEFARTFGGEGNELAYSIDVTNDNGFVIVGETNTVVTGLVSVYLIKTDSLGNHTTSFAIGLDDISEDLKPGIYPNPFTQALQISLPDAVAGENITLNIYDVKGLLIYTLQLPKNQNSSIELGDLPSGIYFTQLLGETFTARNKVIKAGK